MLYFGLIDDIINTSDGYQPVSTEYNANASISSLKKRYNFAKDYIITKLFLWWSRSEKICTASKNPVLMTVTRNS